MINLETYTNRIGSYNPKLKMRKSFPMASASACFLMLAIFLAVTITALAMEMDPSIEKKQDLHNPLRIASPQKKKPSPNRLRN